MLPKMRTMNYDFNAIEKKWQDHWATNQTFQASSDSDKPKYYVLDMFPYPSGAGLHVGHPLGYIASDIFARYKRHKGFNVLHPQGYDSFGLPAEQYAIQTGQHPAITTETNINRYRNQLDNVGFSFDWSKEVRTSSPEYYKWTQWIFGELFNSWYNKSTNKAESIDTLVALFETSGNTEVKAVCDEDIEAFDADAWNGFSPKEKQAILLQYRLTFLAETEVNWCPELGTVLANDEIVNGLSERGSHPVIRKKMTQWSMRISAYAERMLQGLDGLDWTESIKETQRNWIGKSKGASVYFPVVDHDATIEVFTTRPDTIFGVSFMTLAPEHPLVSKITTAARKDAVDEYIQVTSKRSERDRMADVKTISGVFTGAYAEHPFSKKPVPIWIGDYVLASYGTGAVMAVPCGDQRDYDFAKHFDIPIINIFKDVDISEEAYTDKTKAIIANSDFLDGLNPKKATNIVIKTLMTQGAGFGKTNYRLRDAVFSRQRYWGEPFPIYYDADGMPQLIATEHLPINLPEVEKYLPTEDGAPPLGRATTWAWDTTTNSVVDNSKIDNETIFALELNTMPGWAGSSWYLFRYMDAQNEQAFASKQALEYWKNVDLYLGGSEHATGHLLYSRFWTKFLFDRDYLSVEEPFQKMINQGMILGESAYHHIRIPYLLTGSDTKIYDPLELDFKIFISKNIVNNDFFEDSSLKTFLIEKIKKSIPILPKLYFEKLFGSSYSKISNLSKEEVIKYLENNIAFSDFEFKKPLIDINHLKGITNELDIFSYLSDIKYKEFKEAIFISEESEIITFENLKSNSFSGKYITGREVEKMSKSKFNVVNPDDICEEYGADTLRLYEMFLGPLEQAKPWSTAGISGVHNFLKKFWKLYANDSGLLVNDDAPTADALKTLHKTIKKVTEDIDNFSFNTSVSTFMICVNELNAQKCHSKAILEPLAILIAPYAPHIAEEVWNLMGNSSSITYAEYPLFEEKHLIESSKEYPVSFNGKMRFKLELPLDMSKEDIEKTVMAHEKTQKQLQGREPKKVIIVPGKIINIVG